MTKPLFEGTRTSEQSGQRHVGTLERRCDIADDISVSLGHDRFSQKWSTFQVKVKVQLDG